MSRTSEEYFVKGIVGDSRNKMPCRIQGVGFVGLVWATSSGLIVPKPQTLKRQYLK
jgi:hypothetical protein